MFIEASGTTLRSACGQDPMDHGLPIRYPQRLGRGALPLVTASMHERRSRPT